MVVDNHDDKEHYIAQRKASYLGWLNITIAPVSSAQNQAHNEKHYFHNEVRQQN